MPSLLSTLKLAGFVVAGNALVEVFEGATWHLADLSIEADWSNGRGIVMYEGKPLCNDGFTEVEATALCRHFQLGNYATWEPAEVSADDGFGAANLACPDDIDIDDCTFDTDTKDCDQGQGVLLSCHMWTLDTPENLKKNTGLEEDLRPGFGIIHFNGKPLCSDQFSVETAGDALCRTMQLGSHGAIIAELTTDYAADTDEFGADDLTCPENAHTVHDCTFTRPAEEHKCDRDSVILLFCSEGWTTRNPFGPEDFEGEDPRTIQGYRGYVLYDQKPICVDPENEISQTAVNLLCQAVTSGVARTGRWEVRGDKRPGFPHGIKDIVCPRGAVDIADCSFTSLNSVDDGCPQENALFITCDQEGWTIHVKDDDVVSETELVPAPETEQILTFIVYYDGKPLCADNVGEDEAAWLCYKFQQGDSGVLEFADVGRDVFGATNLDCSSGGECDFDEGGECPSGQGVLLQCHRGFSLECGLMGGDCNDKGFVYYDNEPVTSTKFNDAAASAICRTFGGPRYAGEWQRKLIMDAQPRYVLDCPEDAFTVDECTRTRLDIPQVSTNGVYLSCYDALTLVGDKVNAGVVHFNGKPICADDRMSQEAAEVLCIELNLASSKPRWSARESQFDRSGLNELACPLGAELLSECTFRTNGDCQPSSEGKQVVYLECPDL